MALTPRQQHIAHLIVVIGKRRGEAPKRILANLETGKVESNFSNPNHGDGTSIGYRQETASSYPNVNRRNVKAAINRFYNEANQVPTAGRSAGQVAQAVQRSAYPGRYDAVRGDVAGLLHGGGGAVSLGGGTQVVPGVNRSGQRRQLLATYLLGQNGIGVGQGDPLDPTSPAATAGTDLTSTLLKIARTRDTPSKTVSVKGGGGSMNTSGKGVTNFDGKPVAKWIARELAYAKAHGWKGTVTSGYRSVAEQRRIYNSGVRPAAKPGQSNHNFTAFPGGAVDVTDAQQLSNILRAKGSKLVYAGAKDPVHFSHPRGGHY